MCDSVEVLWSQSTSGGGDGECVQCRGVVVPVNQWWRRSQSTSAVEEMVSV